MFNARFDGSFAGWRKAARDLLQQNIAPHEVSWLDQDASGGLFDHASAPEPAKTGQALRIPRQFLELLEDAAQYRMDDRWSLLYRILWRVVQGDRAAMLPGDLDGSELHKRLKAVRRESHHLHAFLRFRPLPTQSAEQPEGVPEFVAWHEPVHDILHSASPHFAERMGLHTWLIATPDDGVYWDGQTLHYQQPCPAHWQQLARSDDDEGQALWLAYYGSTFNPARLNRGVLENNMPVRFWKNLPEGPLIPQLMSQARAGAQRDGQAEAVARQEGKRIRYNGKAPISGSADLDLPR